MIDSHSLTFNSQGRISGVEGGFCSPIMLVENKCDWEGERTVTNVIGKEKEL